MPKTITLDNLEAIDLRLYRDPAGGLHAQVTYNVKSGSEVIKSVLNREISTLLSSTQKSGLQGQFDTVFNAIKSLEIG